MNLRIDLILPEEQRSASAFSLKLLIRVSCVVVPAIILLLIGVFVVGIMSVNSRFAQLDQERQVLETRMAEYQKHKAALDANKAILDKLEGWREARLNFSAQLANLQKEVPAKIQFENLNISERQQADAAKLPERVYKMTIRGKAFTATSELDITSFGKLAAAPAFSGLLDSCDIPPIDRVDGGEKTDRRFSLLCTYKPRKFLPADSPLRR